MVDRQEPRSRLVEYNSSTLAGIFVDEALKEFFGNRDMFPHPLVTIKERLDLLKGDRGLGFSTEVMHEFADQFAAAQAWTQRRTVSLDLSKPEDFQKGLVEGLSSFLALPVDQKVEYIKGLKERPKNSQS